MKGTRIIFSDDLNQGKYDELKEQARLLGIIRSEVWQRFGSIKGVGADFRLIRNHWVKSKNFSPLNNKAWKETLRDGLNNIKLYEAAAKRQVRRQIYRRFKNKETKPYFQLLKTNNWMNDSLLSRWMRKSKKHGKNHIHNQIVVQSGVYTQFKGIDGKTWLKIPSLIKGKPLCIPLNSKVILKGTLRLVLRNDVVEVHYLAEGRKHKACGTQKSMGIDKGYTEVLADSKGGFHGIGFNERLTKASESRMKNNQARNKLHQIAKKSSAKKQARIERNNLGIKKRHRQNRKIKQQIRGLCFQAAHSVVDQAKNIVAEDLTAPIKKKNNWKRFNRLMNQWMKGSITEALETVTKARGSCLHYVSGAYTSQMDSNTHRLEGRRVGDKFHHVNGEVSHADTNAACNAEHRWLHDKEITRYTPYQKIKRILLGRLHASEELTSS